jgi:hypothetical protein
MTQCLDNLRLFTSYESDFDWQMLVEVAAMFRCYSAVTFCSSGPFGICNGLPSPQEVDFCALPANITMVSNAVAIIRNQLEAKKVPIIGVYSATYATIYANSWHLFCCESISNYSDWVSYCEGVLLLPKT